MESNVVKTYYCKKHDYVYYPNDWTSEDGNEHKAGYYDEEGTHYKTIAFEDREVLLTCEYCGTQKKLVWKTGSAPICDNCGATLTIDTTDTIEDIDSNLSNNNSSNNYCSNTNYGHGYENIYLSIVSALLIIGTISFLIPVLNSRTDIAKQTFIESQDTTNYNNSNDFVFESSDDSRSSNYIYVDEIGRTCFKDGEDFYDDETECWFYFNESLYPAQWQYWFESVSGNYGDYGWMEYDDNEQRWYIEVDDGNWQVLPEEEYTDDLWHFDNAFQY